MQKKKILLVRAGGKSKINHKNKVLANIYNDITVLDLVLSLGNRVPFDYRYLHVYSKDKDKIEFQKLANRYNYIICEQTSPLRGDSMKEFAEFLQNSFHKDYFLTLLSGDSPFIQKETLEYLLDLFQSSNPDFLIPLAIQENISDDFLETSIQLKKSFKLPFLLSSDAVDQCTLLQGDQRLTTLYDKVKRIILHPIFKSDHIEYFKIHSEEDVKKAKGNLSLLI